MAAPCLGGLEYMVRAVCERRWGAGAAAVGWDARRRGPARRASRKERHGQPAPPGRTAAAAADDPLTFSPHRHQTIHTHPPTRTALSWLSTRLAAAASEVMTVRAPTRSPYSPMFCVRVRVVVRGGEGRGYIGHAGGRVRGCQPRSVGIRPPTLWTPGNVVVQGRRRGCNRDRVYAALCLWLAHPNSGRPPPHHTHHQARQPAR